jgi:hypothetical protein
MTALAECVSFEAGDVGRGVPNRCLLGLELCTSCPLYESDWNKDASTAWMVLQLDNVRSVSPWVTLDKKQQPHTRDARGCFAIRETVVCQSR